MASSINAQSDATVGTLTKIGDATGNLTIQTNGISAPTWLWQAPVPYPTDGNLYYWDEATLSWVEYIQ